MMDSLPPCPFFPPLPPSLSSLLSSSSPSPPSCSPLRPSLFPSSPFSIQMVADTAQLAKIADTSIRKLRQQSRRLSPVRELVWLVGESVILACNYI